MPSIVCELPISVHHTAASVTASLRVGLGDVRWIIIIIERCGESVIQELRRGVNSESQIDVDRGRWDPNCGEKFRPEDHREIVTDVTRRELPAVELSVIVDKVPVFDPAANGRNVPPRGDLVKIYIREGLVPEGSPVIECVFQSRARKRSNPVILIIILSLGVGLIWYPGVW